ncbi:MAG: AsnC family transcriptional regulator [Dehalococcoidia bacterium]|nr:AsnC family transcriptional regulator [Dehalococcoidia bacterium]
MELDATDLRLLDATQGGFPLSRRPFAEVGGQLGLSEDEVLARLRRLVDEGGLSRFGPILRSENLGGDRTLAAMRVPRERFDEVAALVNAHDAVSHNYEREHEYNMWFVISSEDEHDIQRVISEIERQTELEVINLPSLDEFKVDLRFDFQEMLG